MTENRFVTYRSILRRYWAVFSITVLIVAAAGAANIYRQQPVFEASAQLLIREPMRKSEARGPNPWVLNETQARTQQWLLSKDEGLAEQAIDRLRAGGLDDPAAYGYTKASLPPRVKINAIPGTHLIRLSLTGSDAQTLPAVVNAYAEEYRLREQENRSKGYRLERRVRKEAVDATRAGLENAERVLGQFESANSDLDFAAAENPPAEAARDVAAGISLLEKQQVANTLERRSIEDALAMLGIVVDEKEGRHRLALPGDPTASVEDLLSDDSVVASLEAVRSNSEVSELRNRERAARDRDRSLEKEGRKDNDQRRIAARDEIEEARRQRGRVLVRVITGRLDRMAADAAYLERQQAKLAVLEEAARSMKARYAEHQALVRDVEAARRVHEGAKTELASFDAQYLATGDDPADSGPTLTIEVRVPARVAVQIAPKYTTQITLSALAALGVGLALVLLLDFLDDTIKSKDDIDRYLRVPFLGVMPRIRSADARSPDTAVLAAPPGSPVAEKFRALRTSIHFSRADAENPVRTMLITSAGPGEGKTTVVSNLGITLAKQNKDVLLIDADLRKPRLSTALGVEDPLGLTSILVGDATLEEAVQPALEEQLRAEPGAGRLCVLASGPIPPNPAELLHLDRMRSLIDECRERFDRIIIDSPPLLAVTDAHLLAEHVDGLYVVVLAEKTSRRVLKNAMESLENIGHRAKGVILNDRYRRASGKGYGYYYYYKRGAGV